MREKSIKLENPGEGSFPEEVNLLCALNRGKTPGVNVFTLEMSAALTSVLANITLFDPACEKRSSYYKPVPLICELEREHVQCNVLFPKQLDFLFCFHTDTSSASEDEGSLRRQAALSAALHQSLQNAESWINRSIQGSSTSSSASSTLSHGEGKGTSGSLADVFANTRIGRRWV